MSTTYSFNGKSKNTDNKMKSNDSFDMSEISFPPLSSTKPSLKEVSNKSIYWSDKTKLNIIKEPPTIEQIIVKKA